MPSELPSFLALFLSFLLRCSCCFSFFYVFHPLESWMSTSHSITLFLDLSASESRGPLPSRLADSRSEFDCLAIKESQRFSSAFLPVQQLQPSSKTHNAFQDYPSLSLRRFTLAAPSSISKRDIPSTGGKYVIDVIDYWRAQHGVPNLEWSDQLAANAWVVSIEVVLVSSLENALSDLSHSLSLSSLSLDTTSLAAKHFGTDYYIIKSLN